MYRICSASGTTIAPNEDIMDTIRNSTLLKNSSNDPLILRKANIFLNSNSNIYFNTTDNDIAKNLNKTFVKESFPSSGEYIVATNLSEILISRIVVADAGTSWEITFLY